MYKVQINDNSTYATDLAIAQNVTNSYTIINGDDIVRSVTLKNSFLYNKVSYNIIYINTNGTIGFNSASNTASYSPSTTVASSMSAFFIPWVDTNDPIRIYHKEDITSKIFTLIYDRVYYGSTVPYKVGIKLFLDGSGKAIINFGVTANLSRTSLFGFSFGSNNTSNFTTNTLVGDFNPPISPLVNISDNQLSYNNKQIIITQTYIQPPTPTPTITNFSIQSKIIGDAPFTINQPTSNSSGLFSYTSSNLSVATISGNTITIVGAGTSTITATQAGTTNYSSGQITTTFQVNQSFPTITNFSIQSKTIGDAPFTINRPISNSSGSFSYTSSDLSVATISGNTITIVGIGSSTITATQAGTTNYTQGLITTTFQVNKSTPTITNFSIQSKIIGDAPFTINQPTSNSSGLFSYTSSNLSVATISGNTITIVGVGTSTITASQEETTNYTQRQIATTFQVNKSTPTITNFSIQSKTFGNAPFTINQPTSNSSGLFSYTSSNLSVATISGNTITIVGVGTSTITASQAETTNYTQRQIATTFQVNKSTPTITNFSIQSKTFGNAPFTINQPTSNSSGSFSYTSSDLSVATISGNTITIVGDGSLTITATQAGTTNYTEGQITTTFQVNQSTPTNPVIITNSNDFSYFMTTPSTYVNITNNLEINYDLIATSYKVLTGNDITIKKSN
jgi:uncharacterized protein YjdB